MAESYTKGPWKVETTDTTFNVVSHDGIKVVSTSWHQRLRKPYPLRAEAFANATMCAAAPDLVDALASAKDAILQLLHMRGCEAEGSDADWVGYIDAALARALGQEG